MRGLAGGREARPVSLEGEEGGSIFSVGIVGLFPEECARVRRFNNGDPFAETESFDG